MNESMSVDHSDFGDQVSKLIRSRRTSKILANDDATISFPYDEATRLDRVVMKCIEDAGFAPFHYDRNVDSIAEPWRFYVLPQSTCRHVAAELGNWFDDLRPSNKLAAMLRACGCLALITWIPQFEGSELADKQQQINEEHLAAAAAATQNLLLALTANNLKTYWSSGGYFRTPEMFERLEISQTERLLSAIFIDYGVNEKDVQILGGKQHDARSSAEKWTRVINLDI